MTSKVISKVFLSLGYMQENILGCLMPPLTRTFSDSTDTT